ncbi:HVA22-like protein k [Salvia splendens]|uniref:HVA22-like protein k n=1 Tax=Salvia splendens TaxID=180675 RepID=UPI001C2660F5|nr:HVA22-like protein k [Salvia splendens]
MNFLGSSISSDVGLRLLLCPLGSNIVVRTACCSVGVVLPVYSTFKAIESKDQDDQHKWLVYWAAYGSFTVAETFTDKLLYWCPFYYHLKFAFLVWLQLPSVEGASVLYTNYLRAFLQKHQARLDQIVIFFRSEMVKFASKHETEIQVTRSILTKILLSANQMVKEILHPTQRQIGGPTPSQRVETPDLDLDSDSDSEVEG